MHLSDLKTKHITELVEIATTNQIDNANRMRKQDLIFALLKNQAKKGESIFGWSWRFPPEIGRAHV